MNAPVEAGFPFPARLAAQRARLGELAKAAPQVLLIEGGLSSEREAAAHYYAAALNCREPGAPCGVCPVCAQIIEGVYLDLLVLDGRAGHIKVDEVREVRQKVGEPPRGAGYRVVILEAAQNLTIEAANGLLKSLEEPRPGNVFVLTAPQRERILPTLVSRSWILTLAWPGRDNPEQVGEQSEENLEDWFAAFADFSLSGKGWFERTSQKGRMTRGFAELFVLGLTRELTSALAKEASTPMASFLAASFSLRDLRRLDIALAEAQEALVLMVNPGLTLDWLATRAYGWLRESGRTQARI